LLASPEVPVVFSLAVNPAGADVLPAVDVPSFPTVTRGSACCSLYAVDVPSATGFFNLFHILSVAGNQDFVGPMLLLSSLLLLAYHLLTLTFLLLLMFLLWLAIHALYVVQKIKQFKLSDYRTITIRSSFH
jgi:hypothetical protein